MRKLKQSEKKEIIILSGIAVGLYETFVLDNPRGWVILGLVTLIFAFMKPKLKIFGVR